MADISAQREIPRPPDELLKLVAELFDRVSRVRDPDVKTWVRTSHRQEPSAALAAAALGFDRATVSHWRKGDRPERDEVFAKHLHDGLRGDFDWAGNSGLAHKVWSAFSREPGAPAFVERLILLVMEYRVDLSRGDGTLPESLHLEPAGPGQLWSKPWTDRKVKPWSDGLSSLTYRALYIQGAPRSGKSVLIATLIEQLTGGHPGSTFLHINIRDLIARFRDDGDTPAINAAIINLLLLQLSPDAAPVELAEPYDFDIEMARILVRAPPGHIYLVVECCDAGLRFYDDGHRARIIDGTKAFFRALRPIPQLTAQPPLSRVSLIMEGTRPVRDLKGAYPASPFNKCTQRVLDRLGPTDCAAVARLAGMSDGADIARLYGETDGHRSLLWAILLADEPGTPLPAELGSLAPVADVLDDLLTELSAQPGLPEALATASRMTKVDTFDLDRLRNAMFLRRSDPPECGCPLLEGAVSRRGEFA